MENYTSTPLDDFLKPVSIEVIVLFLFTFTVSLLLHHYQVRLCRCCIIWYSSIFSWRQRQNQYLKLVLPSLLYTFIF